MGCLTQLFMIPFYLVWFVIKIYYYIIKAIIEFFKWTFVSIMKCIKKTNSYSKVEPYRRKNYSYDSEVIDAEYEENDINDVDKEAKLWGLSKEDMIIAKKERMSPADYIEAEERDDDDLDDDD